MKIKKVNKKQLMALLNEAQKRAALSGQVLYFLINRMKNDRRLDSKLARYEMAQICRKAGFNASYEEGIESLNRYIAITPIKEK